MRLNRFLARAGIGSRRKVEEFIRKGEVTVNGRVVREVWFDVDTEKDEVLWRGECVVLENFYYIALNKPKGYISTLKDERGRKTVRDLVGNLKGMIIVGRLDRDSEGLLLITNDGDLAYRVMHPKYGVLKEYIVYLDREVKGNWLLEMKRGIWDGGEKLRIVDGTKLAKREVRIFLREGKKREIRRLFARKGVGVKRLVRVAIGPIRLGDLRPGMVRELSKEEVESLIKAIRTNRWQ